MDGAYGNEEQQGRDAFARIVPRRKNIFLVAVHLRTQVIHQDNGGIHHVYHIRPANQRWQPQGGVRWADGGGSLLKAKLLIEAPSNADRNFSGTLSDSIENYDFIAFFNISHRTSKGGSDNTFFAFHSGKKEIKYTNTGVEVTVINGTQLTFKGSGSSSDYYFVAAVGFKL